MTSERLPVTWRVMTGTARGAAHDARGVPNQDSAESLTIDQAHGIVVAVADGHGHDRHFRSATGSRLAVRTACAVVGKLTADAGRQPWTPERAAALRDRLPETIVARWREAVALDIAAHPYTAAELSVLEEAGDGPDIPYGSTLIVALIAGSWLICAQIGDGDLLAVRPDGGAWSPVTGDDLLDGYRTTSLCQPAAVSAFRTASHDLRTTPLLALLLSTDGYGNAQAEEPWQPVVARDLAELAARHDHGWFAVQLPAWAERCASAAGSADDTTIALLLAPGSERLAAAARPATAADRTVARSLMAEVTQPPRQAPPLATCSPGTFYRGAGSPDAGSPSAGSPGAAVSAAGFPGGGPAPARFSRRRAVTAAIAAVAAAGAIATAVVMSQSSGSGQPPALQPTGQPAPRATPSPSGAVSTPTGPASRPGQPSNGGSATAPNGTGTSRGGATHAQPTRTKPAGNQGG
ncbi:MAG TPA: protein phosphatase 2C domain-containing protein [Trebonia sp.]